jgi:hypothetical protein
MKPDEISPMLAKYYVEAVALFQSERRLYDLIYWILVIEVSILIFIIILGAIYFTAITGFLAAILQTIHFSIGK